MKTKPPKSQLSVRSNARSLECLDERREPDTVREKRSLVVHHHTYNWALIIIALAALIRSVAAVL